MRASGILMHISSLPSPYGIGTLGNEAYKFVDFLEKAGQAYWQILPLCPTSYGDSPYSSFATYAGNPYFIDLDILEQNGWLLPEEYKNEHWAEQPTEVEYHLLYTKRYAVLRKAADRFSRELPSTFHAFLQKEQEWLEEYALFMTIKELHGGHSWTTWEDKYRFREKVALNSLKESHKDDILFWKIVQFFFYEQWTDLKRYANSKGIQIIGDLPIYTAMDSVDVWANTTLFYLNDNLHPIEVAGVPPDAFSADGQLWGNPLYRWNMHKKTKYKWWIKRLRHCMEIYDIVCLDHFRGFDTYYAIPAKDTTARNGQWKKGPGRNFFKHVEKNLPEAKFIAEDLGYLTPSVIALLKDTGFPGMKILQFAFDSREDSDYLPHNYTAHSVVYTGTHDNDTILGWMETAAPKDVAYAVEYLRLTPEEGYHWGMMKSAWASVADTVILQMQDLLGLDNNARMNTPSTIGGNWQWRATSDSITETLAEEIYTHTYNYRRIPPTMLKQKAEGSKNEH